jgi:hypothetical protein
MTTLSCATTRKQPTSTNQDVLTASGDKLKILGRGNFLMRLDDTKDMVM